MISLLFDHSFDNYRITHEWGRCFNEKDLIELGMREQCLSLANNGAAIFPKDFKLVITRSNAIKFLLRIFY